MKLTTQSKSDGGNRHSNWNQSWGFPDFVETILKPAKTVDHFHHCFLVVVVFVKLHTITNVCFCCVNWDLYNKPIP